MSKCISCGHDLPLHTTLDGQTDPNLGDISFCIKCGCVSEFVKNGFKKVDIEYLDPPLRDEVKRIESAWVRTRAISKLDVKGEKSE